MNFNWFENITYMYLLLWLCVSLSLSGIALHVDHIQNDEIQEYTVYCNDIELNYFAPNELNSKDVCESLIIGFGDLYYN